ncbi:cobalamin biosynthesis protein CbiD [Desulfuromonas acetoxidans]|uniref:Cobalt-precorrin-5B C(1)-methyltransferase n=1 Tax=Desulfuromonas acetoxidans (strain DSM 684 / 11070) TaxID=281689 RepID=Q1JZX2_DESA6|nr:cobalt-precorrin-5B (C(1))-methyltransferase CbiD [Desulfuromonas acetoxidans]EAT15770.1 cobalamin biosynthesis protein CbiD [Desulfuromonas acetoxidans DSM 684]MBF0646046.1 cobalamin biosynthesis protein CbiD [Desulfuromonas acetoxidans]NVD25843.1 cobalamin biosynthesis protein CbiD [Desulfuromonas acetoxidans]NVE16875.1 cobalamin biosynthesis protein CbiD [Desulfuromonas acetoxidans]
MSAELKGGITTGSCAALAAKAAALLLFRHERVEQVEIPLPDGSRLMWPVASLEQSNDTAEASIIKDAGDDPDVTHGARIRVRLTRLDDHNVMFRAGHGVGTVTVPGLALAVGEAAINPVPRTMITAAIREVTDHGVMVTVAVDGGEELAAKTFNPKLGIEGGISIIGTSGRVRPFSAPALQQSLKCALDICVASDTTAPVFVPGNMGRNAALRAFHLKTQQVVEVSNEWGYMLEQAQAHPFTALLMLGHPGKLAKLAMGQWNTHSGQSDSAVPFVADLAHQVVHHSLADTTTVEGVFMECLTAPQRRRVADRLAAAIQRNTAETFPASWLPQVVLINLRGEILGSAGDLQPWLRHLEEESL